MYVAKEFTWNMSHRLMAHSGLCKNIHGHTYKLRIILDGAIDVDGMVFDYYSIAEIVQPVIDLLDHAFMCEAADGLMKEFLKANGFKHIIIENEPTAENICSWFADILVPKFQEYKNLFTMKIRVYETSDTYAEIEVSL
jgi:6-pyruvoyltetrahydropterin/6-carboxytetrahydropterin synthase